MEGGTGGRTTGVVNLDRLRPRGVKRTTERENDANTKGVHRKRQKGRPQEQEEDEEDGREEMERLVGLVPNLMGREGSVSQVSQGISAVK